jgi:putative transposase
VRFDPDRYHRRSLRLQGYDYSQPGAYFVTICTHGQECIFGDVTDDRVELSPYGEMVWQTWRGLPERFERIELDQFVVMPNHVHGIIVITPVVGADGVGAIRVGAIHELPLQTERRGMLLPKVIGYFKMNAAKAINGLRGTPGTPVWQRNYYDHIVRNETELHAIQQYILDNPMNWQLDRENPHVGRPKDR